ncbi:MAG: hypothetical protein Q8Q90_00170 [bacterium]|nr:hypothetical protein [bacterium]
MAKRKPVDVSRYYDPNLKIIGGGLRNFKLTPQQLSDLQRFADLERKSANYYIEIGPGKPSKKGESHEQESD